MTNYIDFWDGWDYFGELGINVLWNHELLFWDSFAEWESSCKKLNAIIPVFQNDSRLEFIQSASPMKYRSHTVWFGINGRLTYWNESFCANFRPPVLPVSVKNYYGNAIKMWKPTNVVGIYRPLYFVEGNS